MKDELIDFFRGLFTPEGIIMLVILMVIILFILVLFNVVKI